MAKVHYLRVVDSGKQTAPAPPGLTATAVSTSSITLTWGLVATATSYTVRRFGVTIATGVTALTYTDVGLPASTLETYTVSAVNIYGEGPQSAPASATTLGGGGSLAISTASLPNATVGGSYFYNLAPLVSGGQPPYQFGQLGPNYFGGFNYSVNVPVSSISFTTNAVITLTSAASTHPFAGRTQCMIYPVNGSNAASLFWSGAITALSTSAPWTVTTNLNFSTSIYGSSPQLLNCNLVAGPTGVNPYQLTLTGMLEVVPTTAETASLPIIVTDNTGATATTTLSITCNSTLKILGCSLDLTTQPLPNAMKGNAYQHQMMCAGGSGIGQTWSASGLVSGLSISTAGLITGTPTSSGTSSFTITVTDSVGPPVSHAFSMVVAANANVARPSYNTSTGFFVLNGQTYDPNGAPFRVRGMNQNHFDATSSPSVAKAFGCNTVRVFMYLNGIQGYTASSYVLAVNNILAANALPILTLAVVPALGIVNPTITGTAGQFSCGASTLPILAGSLVQVEGTNTGTGGISGYSSGVTYTVSATNGSTTFTLTTSGGGAIVTTAGTTAGLQWGGTTITSGNFSAADLQTCANWFAANYTTFSPLTAFNVNEWDGPGNTGAEWQTNYLSYVSTIRAAGCKNLLVIDANGDGQSFSTLPTYAAAVQSSDPQQNCVFSFHAYGGCQSIQAQITGITTGSIHTVIGLNYNGPYNPINNFLASFNSNGLPSTVFVNGVGGMTQINGLTIATSSATANGNPGAYSVTVNLNSSAFTAATPNTGTLYSGVHASAVIMPALAALASSNVCCIVGELGPGKSIGPSPTNCTNAQVVAAAEANGLGWMYWAIDDANLDNSNNGQNWFGAQLQNGSGST
jgi:large repetitive protein